MNTEAINILVEEVIYFLEGERSDVDTIRMEVSFLASDLKKEGVIPALSSEELAEARYLVSVRLASNNSSRSNRKGYNSDGNRRWRD